MTNKIGYKTAAILIAGAMLAGLFSLSLGRRENTTSVQALKGEKRTKESAEVSDAGLIKAPGMGKEGRRRMFKKWLKRQKQFSSAAEASRELSFRLKAPKSLGKPTAVYVEKNKSKDERKATISYRDPAAGIDGVSILVSKSSEKLDFAEWATELENNKKAGILKANKASFLVEVNGFQGWAVEPGYNVVGGKKTPRPGFVQWQEDDGVVYEVNGTPGPEGTRVENLLKISRSMSI